MIVGDDMTKKNLENEVLKYISDFIEENSYSPTVREICKHFGFKSTSTAQYYLKKLEEANLISFGGKKRAITLADKKKYYSVPVVGSVTAGQPILAVENIEGYCPLPDWFKYYDDMFMLKVIGTSMINAGIMNGDTIIVRKSPTCDDGDIVIAFIDDSVTCKRLYHRDGKIVLHPENDQMDDMIFDDVSVIGTVCGLIRKF